MDDDRRTVFQSGADDFVSKPCREEDLLEKIRASLGVAYIYEDASGSAGDQFAGTAALSPERLEQLPRELIEELRKATLSGKRKLLDALILKVREAGNSETADALKDLAGKYEYDALLRFLEEVCRR